MLWIQYERVQVKELLHSIMTKDLPWNRITPLENELLTPLKAELPAVNDCRLGSSKTTATYETYSLEDK